jgi:hypothetical protein
MAVGIPHITLVLDDILLLVTTRLSYQIMDKYSVYLVVCLGMNSGQ